jgi:hypothetical protein
MDNDMNDMTEMTCEQAEDELSGYLDDVLDPKLRQRVAAHLTSCARCQEILADFRRNDEMLRALPFLEPPAGMREQFFNSPRYLHLARARERQRSYARPLMAALVAAAMLVVALGGALLIRQGFLAKQQAQGTGTTTSIGASGDDAPLPAGPRLIYERGGALWSAPEHGVGLPRQLTPAGTSVAGWSVSPSGRMVLYIAAQTGALHVIRGDGLNDTVIGSATGGHAPSADFWATPMGAALADGLAWSPDNTRVAYLALSGNGMALHVMNAAGAAEIVANPVMDGTLGNLRWSPDSVYIAYAANQTGAQSVWAFNVTTATATQVATLSDPGHASATVDRFSWQTATTTATLNWSTRAGSAVTGVFRASASTTDSATRITPKGATYTAADVSAGGVWLLAQGAAISEIGVNQMSPRALTTLAHPVTQLVWSPSGSVAAVVTGDTLSLLIPGTGTSSLAPVAHDMTAESVAAWSPAGDTLAWQAEKGVMSAPIRHDAAGAAKLIAPDVTALALAWAPDGQALAAQSATGIALLSATGSQAPMTDNKAESSGTFAWSVAG